MSLSNRRVANAQCDVCSHLCGSRELKKNDRTDEPWQLPEPVVVRNTWGGLVARLDIVCVTEGKWPNLCRPCALSVLKDVRLTLMRHMKTLKPPKQKTLKQKRQPRLRAIKLTDHV